MTLGRQLEIGLDPAICIATLDPFSCITSILHSAGTVTREFDKLLAYRSAQIGVGRRLLAGDPPSNAALLGNATVYGIARAPDSSGTRLLVGIDPQTGEAFSMGETVPLLKDMACFADGFLYGITGRNLFQIDPLTGKAIEIGEIPTSISPVGLSGVASGTNGQLYISNGGATFLTVNPVNGQVLRKGFLSMVGGDVNLGPMAVSPDGRLFGISRKSLPPSYDLIWIEPITAAASHVGSTGFLYVYGIAFANDGSLIGAASTSGSSFPRGPVTLIRIDTSTGLAIPIGQVNGIPEVLSLTGLCSFN